MNRFPDDKGMTLIVKTVTRLTLGFILLYGVYIALNGHIALGGGFAGGVIIALANVCIMLAFGKEAALKKLGSHMLRFIVSVSAIIFLCIVMVNFRGGCRGSCRIFNNEIMIPLCEMVMPYCWL